MPILRSTYLSIYILTSISASLPAQTVETPIYEQGKTAIKENQEEFIQKALKIREEIAAISKAEIEKQLLEPQPEPINLSPAFTRELTTEDIAEHARKSNLRVGYCYKCMSCDHWHLNLAGGYAITPNVIVTCDHVLASKTKMKDGFIIAIDDRGNIACAVSVLARSANMDAAIIKVAGAKFTPVPLNSNIKQGSSSYCFSYPLSQEGYFSTGIVNRFYWKGSDVDKDKESIDALCYLRINYSNEWAPGSSGSPLFDAEGNVTGHVSTISGLSGGKGQPIYLLMHEGIPARSVQQLAATLQNPSEIKRLAMIKVEESTAAPIDSSDKQKKPLEK